MSKRVHTERTRGRSWSKVEVQIESEIKSTKTRRAAAGMNEIVLARFGDYGNLLNPYVKPAF